MKDIAASLWYRRMSLVYVIGAWTTATSLFLSSWQRKGDLAKEEEFKDEVPVEKPEPRRGFYVETIVTYKENFVPYSTRLHNYWKSWSSGPGPSE
ncbi:small integral membrane protein 26 [Monodelphis domestica]|uniref:small integral membrane protein 26 n=1 Tax=Monodelphis domestica TaxID=13616 RepID=UPI0024E25FAF|nr:small integral membrane protein 26 [Monodelphis domestica]